MDVGIYNNRIILDDDYGVVCVSMGSNRKCSHENCSIEGLKWKLSKKPKNNISKIKHYFIDKKTDIIFYNADKSIYCLNSAVGLLNQTLSPNEEFLTRWDGYGFYMKIDDPSMYDRLVSFFKKGDIMVFSALESKNILKGVFQDEIEGLTFIDRKRLKKDTYKKIKKRIKNGGM